MVVSSPSSFPYKSYLFIRESHSILRSSGSLVTPDDDDDDDDVGRSRKFGRHNLLTHDATSNVA